MNAEQIEKVSRGVGFVAALDQSGGSTPGALERYGIGEDRYSSEKEMLDLVHNMRARIITSSSFGGDRIVAAILFQDTMDREIDGRPTARYLWEAKRVVPFLKIDKGLEAEKEGAHVMKPIPDLADLLARAVDKEIFGTKMRSVITAPGAGLAVVVQQQFDLARRILATGLLPIVEPEVDIHSAGKAQAEDQLRAAILDQLAELGSDQKVMLKLTLPERDDLYLELVRHPRVVRVLALSGGYSRAEANARLARNHGVIASFSRALTEGLTEQQTDKEFDATLNEAISSIATASRT